MPDAERQSKPAGLAALTAANLPAPEGRPQAAKPRITVSSEVLIRRQRLHFLILNIGSLLFAVAALVWGVAFGVTATDFALFLAFYLLTIVGIEIGFHRLFSHSAFMAAPPLKAALAILGMMAGQGPVAYWAANHRRHHTFSDRPGDPHSPRDGFWHAHLLWVLDREVTFIPRFASDLMADPLLRALDRRYPLWVGLGLIAPAVIGGLIGQSLAGAWSAFLWGGALRLCVVQHGVFFINSGCHRFGDRPFGRSEGSTNIGWLSLPTLGGTLHHNHHAFPASATTAFAKGDIDPSFGLIRLFERAGWARQVVLPDPASIALKRAEAAGSADAESGDFHTECQRRTP